MSNENGSTTTNNGSDGLTEPNSNGGVVSSNVGEEKRAIMTIEDLYRCFGVLADANDQAGQHVETYLQIVSGTKGGSKEKTLASQFITRFFKYFPKEMPIAIDAIFDLCEDDDVSIRKAAIKDLAMLSKDCPVELLNRIADILTQLLQTDDQAEFAQVQASLLTVFKQNPKSTLGEIFNQITTAELEEVRKRAIKFLVSKIPTLFGPGLSNTIYNKEFEDLVVTHVKQVLVDVDAEEFVLFVKLLSSLPSMNTIAGKMDLVDIIMAQSELDKPFDGTDMERIMILLSCIQQAITFFSKTCPSTKYFTYYVRNVLSVLQQLEDDNLKFEILKSLAELSIFYVVGSGTSQTANQPSCTTEDLDLLFGRLLEYLPKPDLTESADTKSGEDQKFNFSYVECLLYAFHAVARYHETYLNAPEETTKERARDFRLRLQYFAKGTQNYIKELRNSLLSASALANKENEENKVRRVALKVTTNIDILIKDFFQNPPSYKGSIVLSWKSNEMKQLSTEAKTPTNAPNKPPTSTNIPSNEMTEKDNVAGKKRALSTDAGSDSAHSLKKKPERGIYQPPSGKYSSNVTGAASNGNGSNQSSAAKRRTTSTGMIGGGFRNGRRF